MSATQEVARYIADLSYGNIPEKNLKDMKILLLDYLAVAIRGARMSSGEIVARFTRDLAEREESTIIVHGYSVSAHGAAFCNAIASHSIELDDTDSEAFFHFSPTIFSGALAMAERERVSGKSFLTAVVAACDIVARLSRTLNPMLRDRGFHTTATCGIFGVATAAGKILGLDEGKQTSALGLAGAQSSGLMEMYGTSMQKRFNPGPAARDGVIAALLAQRGFTGAETILEGQRGFCRAFADVTDLTRLTQGLGKEFPIFVEYKPYACARPIHNAIDCALEIRKKHDINIADINGISVRRHPAWAHYHAISEPQNYHEAQVSLPYSVAIGLIEGKAFIDQYSDDRLKDKRVLQLARKVNISADPSLPRGVSCAMEIKMKDGTLYNAQVDYAKGSMENPMTAEERIDKFQSLASAELPAEKRATIISMVDKLEELKDMSELCALLY
ncbi:MmgE/PrpD family protein [Chloroflexota bacterium]